MGQLTFDKSPKIPNRGCADLMAIAEQELSAFFGAVTELFGSEQAELSAEDWLNELIATETLPDSTSEWRSISTRVSTRLATRVNASSQSTQSKISRRKGLCAYLSPAPQAS
jgi:hypothetical protein